MILPGKISKRVTISELVAIYGNFVNRAVVLTHKYFQGVVPLKGALTTHRPRSDCSVGGPFLREIAASIERYRFPRSIGYYDGSRSIGQTNIWQKLSLGK